jgi:hypothetical protein
MKKATAALLTSLLILLSFSCNDSDRNEDLVNCTEEFVTITVKLSDENKEPVTLDSYKVFLGNEDITPDLGNFSHSSWGQYGYHPIIDDGMQSRFEGKEVGITFIGYLSEQEVIRKDITVGAGVCHVYCNDKLSFTIVR